MTSKSHNNYENKRDKLLTRNREFVSTLNNICYNFPALL